MINYYYYAFYQLCYTSHYGELKLKENLIPNSKVKKNERNDKKIIISIQPIRFSKNWFLFRDKYRKLFCTLIRICNIMDMLNSFRASASH